MKTKMRIGSSLIVAACTILFSSCKKENTSPGNYPSGYSVYMTDAPGDYQAVYVNITGVEAMNDQGTWTPLNMHAISYNLASLINGKDSLVASGTVSGQSITQIRLMFASTGNTVVVNNAPYTMQLSASAQAGIVVNVNTALINGGGVKSTIDFDAGMSVRANGSGSYILEPVIRPVGMSGTGAIEGTISPSTAESTVLAISSGADTASTYSNIFSGGFDVQGLNAGAYTVVIMPWGGSNQVYANVMVSGGGVTNMGTITFR